MDGLAVGSLYALIALGYTMVYGILKFINFAHSDVFVLGAWVSYTVALNAGFTASGENTQVAAWVMWALTGILAAGVLMLVWEKLLRGRLGLAGRSGLGVTLLFVSGWG